jgi:hypothetical protein
MFSCVPDVLQTGKEDKSMLHYTINPVPSVTVAKRQVNAVSFKIS